MVDLTAIILTKNEEKNIEICINSIKSIAKRIIVIDSFSTDNTVKLAQNLGAEVYQHKFVNYSKQFSYGLHSFNISTTWVLRIDADESLSKDGQDEIEKFCIENMNNDINGLIINFEYNFMGKEIKHGGLYPFKKLLLFKYGKGDIEDRYMDEHIILSEGTYKIGKAINYHRDYKNLTYWINKHNWYSDREAYDYLNRKNDFNHLDKKAKIRRFIKFNVYYKLPFFLRVRLYYWYRLYFKLAFLDGKEGRALCYLHAYWYRYLVDLKIYEAKKNNALPEVGKDLH